MHNVDSPITQTKGPAKMDAREEVAALCDLINIYAI